MEANKIRSFAQVIFYFLIIEQNFRDGINAVGEHSERLANFLTAFFELYFHRDPFGAIRDGGDAALFLCGEVAF